MAVCPVSVIVVSRHRPAALARALLGLSQQDHPLMEVIVVADPAACAGLRADGLPAKLVTFDDANISAARNLGLAQAAGEVVAFLDDDAVPEPSWLSRLVAPFAAAEVAAAGGYVLGRNGLSFQWRAGAVDRLGRDRPLAADPDATTLHRAGPGLGIKTQGTNCAFRTDMLRRLGGFDPAFRFYLDEADVNLRLAALGAVTAIVPLALVHHGYAESARRRPDRVPLSLHDIGASTMVFLRRHAAPPDWSGALASLRAEQHGRLVSHMVAGRIEPRDIPRLMGGLDGGIAEGAARALPAQAPLPGTPPPFVPLPGTGPRGGLLLQGLSWQRRSLLARAREAVAQGRIVTVLCLSPTALFHRHAFTADGFWLQQGGIYGRAERTEPLVRLMRLSERARQESRRLARFRPLAGPDRRTNDVFPLS